MEPQNTRQFLIVFIMAVDGRDTMSQIEGASEMFGKITMIRMLQQIWILSKRAIFYSEFTSYKKSSKLKKQKCRDRKSKEAS